MDTPWFTLRVSEPYVEQGNILYKGLTQETSDLQFGSEY